jgi:hypothetical protein
VLKEVSQALLVILLLDSTYIVVDVEARLTLWLLIVADVVGHTVFELTYTHFWIEWQLGRRILCADTRYANNKRYE